MKKRLLLLSMVSIVALTGCDVSQLKDKDGNQIIVKLGDSMSYTANELFDHYSDTSAGTSQYFNAVYDVLIRAAQDKTTAIEQEVARRIDDFHQDAEDAASENNTSVRTELSKALEAKGIDAQIFEALKGNTALMLSNTGNAPAKLIKEFTKKEKNKEEAKPQLKAAYVEETVYVGAQNLDFLATIKSKNELIADLVALLQSPAKNVVSALQSGGTTIHGVLKTLGERAE